MSLYDATRDLHHACERQAVGQRMAEKTTRGSQAQHLGHA